MPTVTAPIEVSPVIVDPVLPADPQLRAIANDVVADIRYSLAAVSAEDQPGATGALDNAFRAVLARQRPGTRERFRQRARAVLNGPAPLRTMHFGRFAAVDLSEYPSIGSNGLRARMGKLSLDPHAVNASLAKSSAILLKMPPATHSSSGKPVIHIDADAVAGLAFKKMRLFIRKVRCVQETSGVFEGSDEVNMGGNFTSPDGQTTTLVNQFKVSDAFDEGELVDFGFSKAFANWDLATNAAGLPYVYAAVISLAEKDDGGFHKFLQELWAQVHDRVKTAVTEAVAGAIGGVIGGVIGFVAATVVVAIVDWIVSLFDNADDIIGTRVFLTTLAAMTKSYYDSTQLTSPEGWLGTLHFRDDGYYRVAVSLKVFTQ